MKQKGGTAVLATLISMDGVLPKGERLKALLKLSGEKVGSL